MMLIRPVSLVLQKKGICKEESNGHLKSLLPGLNLSKNERKCHEHSDKFGDCQQYKERT